MATHSCASSVEGCTAACRGARLAFRTVPVTPGLRRPVRVGRVIASTRTFTRRSPKLEGMASVQGKQIRLGSSVVGVNPGECALAALTVQYLERDSSDPNRTTFMLAGGPVCLAVNCSFAAFYLKLRPVMAVGQVPARQGKQRPKPATVQPRSRGRDRASYGGAPP